MSAPLEMLLSRMESVRKAGGGNYACRCPAHTDKSASLSIKEGDDGRVLLWCFAGCSALEVVQSVGLELSDLWPERIPDTDPLAWRKRKQAAREAALVAGANVLAEESLVVLMALRTPGLSENDWRRVSIAVSRIENVRRTIA
jgi:hypothetical protein